MKFSAPKGTYDIYGDKIAAWRLIEKTVRELCRDYNIGEIRTPVFENTELFQRSVGETTDIVQKEMFTFEDRGGRSFTLKPEGTAGVARAYIENGMGNLAQPVKLYYLAPNFRAERPQQGRYRQFFQFGVEIFGSYAPAADAELISLAWDFYRRLGIDGLSLRINSIGNAESRKVYNGKLIEYLKSHEEQLCPLCRERMEKNPLRVLDCKNEECGKIVKNAPKTLDWLLDDCREHFEGVKAALESMGIPYIVDSSIVRGLDYYTRTVFEITSDDLGGQSAVCGGGRYDNLIEECGGSATGAVGFAGGIERALILLEQQGKLAKAQSEVQVYIGAIGSKPQLAAQGLVYKLRCAGIAAETDIINRSVKAQFKYADKLGAAYACMLGEDELASGRVELKRMEDGERFTVELDKLEDFFTK